MRHPVMTEKHPAHPSMAAFTLQPQHAPHARIGAQQAADPPGIAAWSKGPLDPQYW